MGVFLTPIIKKRILSLDNLGGKSFAVDAFNVLYQFLALIRNQNRKPLSDSKGNITSHLVGLAFRTTRLVSDYNMKFVFVFDGEPPQLKMDEVKKRKKVRKKAEKEYKEAFEKGEMVTAYSKSVMPGRLTKQGVLDAQRLLDLLGIPWVQAPSEGEAQTAYMTSKGDVWAVNSRDYDAARARAFLFEESNFSKIQVEKVVKRMKQAQSQKSITDFLGSCF